MSDSLKNTVEASSIDIVAGINLLFCSPVMERKILIIIEGKDDIIVYTKLFDDNYTELYPIGGCLHYEDILENLNNKYEDRMILIKDADFDKLNNLVFSYDNLFLTDGHDLEMMIFTSEFEDFLRNCFLNGASVDIFSKVEYEIRNISYIKWFNQKNSFKLNVESLKPFYKLYNGEKEVTIKESLSQLYSVNENRTKQIISESDIEEFESTYHTEDYKNLTNGHDLCEGVAHKIKSYSNVDLKGRKPNVPEIDNLARAAYSLEVFKKTALYKKLSIWEQAKSKNIIRRSKR